MSSQVKTLIKKNFNRPDDKEEFPGAIAELVKVGAVTVSRNVFEPGWHWPEDMESCQVEHLIWFVISGRMAIKMDDGHVEEFGPGDIGWLPPGHIVWVVGNEPVVALGIDEGGIDKEQLS